MKRFLFSLYHYHRHFRLPLLSLIPPTSGSLPKCVIPTDTQAECPFRYKLISSRTYVNKLVAKTFRDEESCTTATVLLVKCM